MSHDPPGPTPSGHERVKAMRSCGPSKPSEPIVGSLETKKSIFGMQAQDPFSLKSALSQPSLLRTTSDLRNLRIERRGPTGVQIWNIDGSDAEITASFWLRDGDRIEVPDLPTSEKYACFRWLFQGAPAP
ncbi:MAG: hypothetical protein ACKPGK_03725 [Verrucomicrobiota bacterium]